MEHILAIANHGSESAPCAVNLTRRRTIVQSRGPRSPQRPRRRSTTWWRIAKPAIRRFWLFEKGLLVRIAVLGCCLIRLFLTARHERLDVRPYLEDGAYRPGDEYSERTLKTLYGEVKYGRQYLMARWGGGGFFPLDRVLGLPLIGAKSWVFGFSRLRGRGKVAEEARGGPGSAAGTGAA